MKEQYRVTSAGLLFITIFLALFVAFNGDDTNVRIAMISYAVISGLIAMFMLNVKQFEFGVIGKSISKNMLIGVGLGVFFIFLNQLNSAISLGAPQSFIALGVVGLFIALVLVAPIVEEFMFRGFLYPILYNAFGKRVVVSAFMQAIAFSIFHWSVYGGFLGLYNSIGVFIGAGLFGLIMGFAMANNPEFADITGLEKTIVAHMIFNFFLYNQVYQVITF